MINYDMDTGTVVGWDAHKHSIPNHTIKFTALGGSKMGVFDIDDGRTSDADDAISDLEDYTMPMQTTGSPLVAALAPAIG